MRSAIILTVIALTAALVVPRYATRMSAVSTPIAAPVAAPASLATETANPRSVVVPRDARGHFRVEARVQGRQLSFMIDTGASAIALTESDAARLGIRPAQREFVAEVRTANGTVRAAPTRLDMVEVGDLMVRDVAALVLPDRALSDNLLGLSFLSRLRRFEFSDGKLVLEQ